MAAPALVDPYRGLDPGDELWLREQTDRIRGLFRRTAEMVLETGALLAEIKQRLGEGPFLAWFAASELPFKVRTAENLMQAAKVFGPDVRKVCEFDPSALYLLSSPSTPPEARELALKVAEQGHRVTYTAAVKIVADWRRLVEIDPDAAGGAVAVRPARIDPVTEALLLCIPDGEREARLDVTVRRDPDDSLVLVVGRMAVALPPPPGAESGRNPTEVLRHFAERVRAAHTTARYEPDDPALVAWCDGIAGGIAGDLGFRKGDSRWDDIRDHARLWLVKCCHGFNPDRVKPDSTEEDAFKGWADQTIRRECYREYGRLRNGGTYHTTRTPGDAPSVGAIGELEPIVVGGVATLHPRRKPGKRSEE